MKHDVATDTQTQESGAETALNSRAAHACPDWCTVTPQEHTEDLWNWENYRIHSAVLWDDGHSPALVRISCSTTPTGAVDLEDPPCWDLGNASGLTADVAREMAAALIKAADAIDALTQHKAVA
jgi:hypothetical protein